ncbi:MAG: ATP-binding protein [Bacteroidales bacterium]|nr:ATP-binding protein [Bacteroidales bacterium]
MLQDAQETELLRKIKRGENQTQDFKFAITDSKKIAKSLSAFANTDGGSLLIGVKDNGKIAGANVDEEYYMIETAAQIFCKPEVKFSAKIWEVENKTVLEIIIPKGTNPPYKAKDANGKYLTYVRVNDENILADRIIVKWMENTCKSRNTKINYSRKEEFVLQYIEEKGSISVSEVIKFLQLTKYEAEDVMIELISVGLIKPEFNDKIEIRYIASETGIEKN